MILEEIKCEKCLINKDSYWMKMVFKYWKIGWDTLTNHLLKSQYWYQSD